MCNRLKALERMKLIRGAFFITDAEHRSLKAAVDLSDPPSHVLERMPHAIAALRQRAEAAEAELDRLRKEIESKREITTVGDRPIRLRDGVWVIYRTSGALCMQAAVIEEVDSVELPGTYIRLPTCQAYSSSATMGESDMKTTRKQPKDIREIARIAVELRRQADEAQVAYVLLDTKARLAKAIDDNGASIHSLAEKLGWNGERLHRMFGPETDIDIRVLSDIYTALGREVHFKVVEKPQ